MSRAAESADDSASDAGDTTSDQPPSDGHTDIGVYTGADTLLAAAPARPTLGTGFSVDAGHVRERAAILATTLDALRFTPFDSSTGEAQVFAAVWHQIRPQLYDEADELVAYLSRFDAPRVVLAERHAPTATLWQRRTTDGNGAWLPVAARQAVTDRAREAGIPVVRVAAPERRDDCHRCGATGRVDGGQLACPGESCPVGEVGRGQNAAVHLARRGGRE